MTGSRRAASSMTTSSRRVIARRMMTMMAAARRRGLRELLRRRGRTNGLMMMVMTRGIKWPRRKGRQAGRLLPAQAPTGDRFVSGRRRHLKVRQALTHGPWLTARRRRTTNSTKTPSTRLGTEAPLGVGIDDICLPRAPLIQSTVAAASPSMIRAWSRPFARRGLGQLHPRRPRAANVVTENGVFGQVVRGRRRQPFAEAPQDIAGGL